MADTARKAPAGEPKVMGVPEFAAELGITVPAAYAHVARHNVETVRVGRRVFVPRDALERLKRK